MRKEHLYGIAVGFLAALATAHAADAQRPNILLILADDVGARSAGMLWWDFVSNAEHRSTCRRWNALRARVCDGRVPPDARLPDDWAISVSTRRSRVGTFPKTAENRTLAQVLKRAGYATAIAGKWQLALLKDDLDQPNRMGFDEYCLYGWHEGPWYYQPHIWQNGNLRNDVHDRYGPDVICDYVIDFIERHKSVPFFAFYSMELCHAETNDLDKPAPVGPIGRYESYAEMVAKMDERVGRVIAALDKLGLRENTLMLFLADNGTAAKNLINAERRGVHLRKGRIENRRPRNSRWQGDTHRLGHASADDRQLAEQNCCRTSQR